ncbi:hypothetical protein M3G50_01070 [Brachybacterium muris]|uniref:hypothetical protein n=1 Tax=Brachybacterium muris TaxID=219301 RepID=UPI0021A46442|nr:hypothetical protein [Brachybacterium muris]MCT1429360.1 hypothetical protein [Brachybacterium muris]
MRALDVVLASDFRLPGGTNHSNAQELAIQKRLGLTTGLIQCNSRLSARPIPWSASITAELDAHSVRPLDPSVPTHARLALLRHPVALEALPNLTSYLAVDQALIIANQPPVRPSGTPEYDIAQVTAAVQERLGITPTWAPISPVVREGLKKHGNDVRIADRDWINVFAQEATPPPRVGFTTKTPRIGRHSRPQKAKWPATASEILQAYPPTDDYDVRILGGTTALDGVLTGVPSNWTVHPFGSLSPQEFLADVDFWVYFHHPDWLEAYGRAIMEALWSGAVVILPEYFRATYGDAAVYCKPADVRRVIDEFRSGKRNYLEQSVNGQTFAQTHGPAVHEERLLRLLEQSPSPLGNEAEPPRREIEISQRISTSKQPSNRSTSRPPGPKALFITSNGSGMGHLTRLLGLARQLANDVEPVFFSMSQGVSVAGLAGFSYEYVPYTSALKTRATTWNEYFRSRVLAAIAHHHPSFIVFDGTWPYKGLMDALEEHPEVRRVWVRRAMWKPGVQSPHLDNPGLFDTIIEPGEYARTFDRGATTAVGGAVKVPPMTVLSEDELLPRQQARAELGLSSAPDRHYALVTLGAGNINSIASTQEHITAVIADIPGWDSVVTKPPIATRASSAHLMTLSTFPMAKYTRAFDFAVSAAGYNSFSEWITGCLPTVWIPNTATKTDDQEARAQWAAYAGIGECVSDQNGAEVALAVGRMTDDSVRDHYAARLAEVKEPNGSPAAADIVMRILNNV